MTEQDYAEERSSGSRKRRSRSSSRSPRGSRHRHHRHDDGFYHDTLVVTGLSKDATEETVRQAFVPFGSLKRVSLVTDEVTKLSIGVSWVKFFSSRDAARAYDACQDPSSPMLVEEYPVSVSWAKRDSSSSNHRRSSNSISYREMQQQIDWAAGNAQKQHSSQQSPAGFILDPSSGLYFHAESQVYYDPVSQLFYNCASQSYYRFDTKLNTYIHVDASSFASSNPPPKAVNPTEPQENAPPPSQPSTPKPEVPLQTATNVPASKPAPASVKFSILGKKQSKDMDRWNKKKGELVADELVEVKKPIAPIKIKSLPTTSVPKSEIHVQGGIRPRLYVSMEKLVCLLCQRKFKDERQLTKHELSSELHKQNLNLDEYTQVQRLEQSAASLGINLQPKSNPVVIKKRPPVLKRPTSVAPAPAPVVEAPPEPFSEANVGNRLLQSMGWKQGDGLGKHGLGITENVTAQIRSERAGLGCNATSTPIEVSAGDNYKTMAAKIARARYDSGPQSALMSHDGN